MVYVRSDTTTVGYLNTSRVGCVDMYHRDSHDSVRVSSGCLDWRGRDDGSSGPSKRNRGSQ